MPKVIFQNLFTHLDWIWFRVDYYCDWNWLTVIIDFVSRVARHCKVSSILEIWSYNKSAIAHLTYNDVIRDINQVKTRWAKSVWCETVCTLNKFVYGIKTLSTLDLCYMYIVLSCFFVMTFILHLVVPFLVDSSADKLHEILCLSPTSKVVKGWLHSKRKTSPFSFASDLFIYIYRYIYKYIAEQISPAWRYKCTSFITIITCTTLFWYAIYNKQG